MGEDAEERTEKERLLVIEYMIEYISNGMPTWVYVLIGIAVYAIAKRFI